MIFAYYMQKKGALFYGGKQMHIQGILNVVNFESFHGDNVSEVFQYRHYGRHVISCYILSEYMLALN